MNAHSPTGSLAFDLHCCYSPRNPYEKLLVQQLIWAAVQLNALLADAPAEPDVKWLRLYNAADRAFHRNHRLLSKAGLYALPAAPPTVAPATEPKIDKAQPAASRPSPAAVSPGPWPPELQPSPDGALTRRMRALLTQSDDPDALVADWVACGLLPAPPQPWRDALRQRDDQQAEPSVERTTEAA